MRQSTANLWPISLCIVIGIGLLALGGVVAWSWGPSPAPALASNVDTSGMDDAIARDVQACIWTLSAVAAYKPPRVVRAPRFGSEAVSYCGGLDRIKAHVLGLDLGRTWRVGLYICSCASTR